MKANVAEMTDRMDRTLGRWPLVYRSLVLLVALGAYFGGLLGVNALAGDARLPVVLFAVFFLPAVLRAWLMVYWLVRKDPRAETGAANEKVI
ncbi:hypothetical protein S7S_16640 [Isoalcanivorax pacificus W11-5]|jgi:hypothetical protein|uniref:Transmembrane protein n=1 Tax=Isoalcanivorax pacificus W11-5 TaxID=391936 RepID=A0A0B4XSM0_9GAMM|nr:hypothetical protein [Isoalcanivorax pacificus]AJD49740.1 hypothetical protein S7S_16640 [Isoalcanivorax pacificus W11-5]